MARSQLHQINSYLRPHYRDLILGTVALFLVNALGTYIPWLIRTAIDQLSVVFTTDQVMHFVVIISVLASIMWVIRMASRMWLFGIGRSVEFDLRQKIFEHLLKLPPSYFSHNSAGNLISIATSDVENIRRLLGFAVLSLINTVFAYAMTLPAMLALNPQLSLLAIAPYSLMLILVQMFGGQLRDQQLKIQEELSNASSLLQEDLNGMALIKTYAQEENERQAFNKVNQRLLDANLQMALTRNLLFPVLGGIASISLLILLWFGGEAIATNPNGNFKIGSLIALFIYVERLIFPTALLGFTITTYQRGRVSIARIETILQTPPTITDLPTAMNLPIDQVKGRVTAKNLTFTYPEASSPALDHINFEIAAGETVAIIGAVGSGKSTLANALPRLLDIESGQLFIDGIDITAIKLDDLRAIINYVPQDSFLFSATMSNNIRYGKPDAPMSEVEYFASQAGIENEILNFPQKYETLVGERGITLSGGQRQRTALARALLVDSPILLLDDALSSVDNQTATTILENLPKHKTVIFISHQLAAAANCDRVILMDKGKVAATGTHQELLQSSDLYNKLWNQHKLQEVLR
ncbi:ABC-type multidrug transport system, ATPase and permease component [Synechococcus sp. PCC 7502]|uniref:ABC transporter ATP-binding protein n=1 Tax=Synechococcus sp. PCC 7502 TaxID=1173263 RepID=UPI00029FBFCB|nr:ABC transporter ATP-binding protein [Synechococcus sp. PCC 7502]AFY73389.1 ABC-type multidrug transport system, ATPase and permease component [Synechococcus sp. PCC 7502]